MDLFVDVLLAQKIGLCCNIDDIKNVLKKRRRISVLSRLLLNSVAAHHPVGCCCYLAP